LLQCLLRTASLLTNLLEEAQKMRLLRGEALRQKGITLARARKEDASLTGKQRWTELFAHEDDIVGASVCDAQTREDLTRAQCNAFGRQPFMLPTR